jgi:CspA family cold shock protein
MFGNIKLWKRRRGFGFIRPDLTGPDIFVHITRLESRADELHVGDRVQFDIRTTPRNGKAEASDVKLIED